ncbi:MAG: DNA internalization-related competence protein ComEC/Rec2 [Sedimentibacter sp.]|uniref:DNA internalization-related competence protein ComEC/Rec2 n=1 Tax=Sedimentibacter sp. TaxID=1960295 RepID=UPI0029825C42|nr:DNA internalization-related competence protein ComEC/Rec2 [Sedimentibacter sp.]MDW5300518.1 DNA internalization-related competence protein ComEC/Rec2 [Sedimentibacter sp.]
MYIIISIFAAYAMGIISYELGFFNYLFTAVFVLLIYNGLISKKFIYNIVIIAFLLLSFINCNYNSKSVLAQHINENIQLTAKIKSQNKTEGNSYFSSYNAVVTSINGNKLKNEEQTIIYTGKKEKVEENSIIIIKGNVADTNISKNKLLFNYKSYLRSKKIHVTIFAEGSIDFISEKYSAFNEVSIKFRKYAENTFYKNLNEKNADIILSIILGDVDYLDEDLYDNIKEMGLAHIFAVSGTHIVLMYGFLLTVLKVVGLSRRVSWVATWGLIWFYGFLIGFPLSVMRTLVMFTLLFGSEVLYRKYSSLNAIGLAALILTIYNPYWIFDAGFLLSFSAALSFIIYNKYIAKNIITDNIIVRSICMYLFLQIFTLPVIAYYFNYVPVMGIIYNLLLLPIFTVILMYGFILLILNGLCSILLIVPFRIFNYIITSLRYILYLSDEFAFNGMTVETMSMYSIIFFYIVVFFVIYLYNNKASCIRKYGFITLTCFYAVTYVAVPMSDDSLYFNVADAGQGLFTTVKYKDVDIIIDCGSTSSNNFGEYTVVPYLTKRGTNEVDGVFISHWDKDHYSGLNDLINSHIEIKNIFASSQNDEINKNIKIINKDGYIKIDGSFNIKILWPDENYISQSKNNSSLVLLLKYKNKSILLPGDIEENVENLIFQNLKHANILIAPHHGSKTSSSEGFVEAVKPKIAVLSYGKNNYGIPSEQVLARYEKVKSTIISTYEQGEINFILKDDEIYYNTYTNEKSDNYYKLYFVWIFPKLFIFCILLVWIMGYKKEECYELQNNKRFN